MSISESQKAVVVTVIPDVSPTPIKPGLTLAEMVGSDVLIEDFKKQKKIIQLRKNIISSNGAPVDERPVLHNTLISALPGGGKSTLANALAQDCRTWPDIKDDASILTIDARLIFKSDPIEAERNMLGVLAQAQNGVLVIENIQFLGNPYLATKLDAYMRSYPCAPVIIGTCPQSERKDLFRETPQIFANFVGNFEIPAFSPQGLTRIFLGKVIRHHLHCSQFALQRVTLMFSALEEAIKAGRNVHIMNGHAVDHVFDQARYRLEERLLAKSTGGVPAVFTRNDLTIQPDDIVTRISLPDVKEEFKVGFQGPSTTDKTSRPNPPANPSTIGLTPSAPAQPVQTPVLA